MFNKVVTMLAGTSALLCATQLPTTTSAAHLKVHAHNHHKKSGEAGPYTKFLEENYDDTYAVCVFHHPDQGLLFFARPASYSVAFFNERGDVLEGGLWCNQQTEITFDELVSFAKNPNDWSEEEIDTDSKCYRFKTQAQDAEDLITSYTCD